MRLDKALLDLAAEQRSCIATWQIRELGGSRTEISRLRSSPQWSPVGAKVLAIAGVPHDLALRASAAVLAAGPGAVLSHVSATAWWGLPGFRLLPTILSQVSGHASRVHQLGDIHDLVVVPERWVTTFNGIRVVRPELAAYQLCGMLNPLRAARAFDNFWARGLLCGPSAQRCLDDLAQRGLDGTVIYRDILNQRGPGYIPPTTNLESRMKELGEEAGINLRRQVNLGDEQWDGRVDFLEDDVKLVVEVQSELHHSSLCDVEADGARRARLEADGFSVLEVWDTDVWTRGSTVVAELRRGVRAAKSH
jgi:very-short-patch-repair endonuclease